ncbi:tetratricopeptide repeat protein [Natranaerobius trueperi]|uniref:Uncharacterized protein n=1 Tax=Natranaerobius trueperi TaxID=759412 RepID=A0A226BVL0_9FIRM|nr:tetratricopeptide repeat protein [Natranaerobius trueperi]OWZ82931.1 hypothetical protein CDO51_11445 [Natranaerobius trueperi]
MSTFDEQFQEIFNELNQIEEDIKKNPHKTQSKDVNQKLVDLRKEIDKCIGYWLQFEEKLWAIQDEYGLDIPDQLDDSLISAYLGLPEDFYSKIQKEIESETNDTYEKESSDRLPANTTLEESSESRDHSIKSFRKGLGYFDLSMLDEAKAEFENVVNEDPDMIMGHYFLGLAHMYREEYDSALKKFRLVLALVEDNEAKAMLYNAIGNIYVNKDEQEKALTYFLRACDYSSELVDTFYNCGVIYFNLGDLNNSIKYFSKALHISEDSDSDWELHLNIGKAHTYLGDLDRAMHHLKKALAINPKHEEIHFELGVVYHLKHQEHLAKKEYEKARKLSQKYSYKVTHSDSNKNRGDSGES